MTATSRILLMCLYTGLAFAYLVWGWSSDITDFGGDSAAYILTAKLLSPFVPSTPVLTDFARQIFFPPLFPFLIGLFGGSILAGHLVVITSLLVALPCLYFWLRDERLGTWTSAWTVAVFALMPGTYLQALNIWTENTFVFLSLLAILAVNRADTRGESQPSLWWIAAAAVASATLIRVAGLPILVAFCLHLLLRRPARWPWLIAATCVPFVAWTLWSKFTQAGVSVYGAQWAASYAQHPLQTLITQLWTESQAVLAAWCRTLLGEARIASLYWVALAAGLLCLAGWFRRLLALRFDALYVGLYGALLFAWPHPEEAVRYGYVVLPVLLAQGILLAAAWTDKAALLPRAVPALVLVLLSFALLPTLMLTIGRFSEDVPAEIEVAKRTEAWYMNDREEAVRSARTFSGVLQQLHAAAAIVPEGGCIFASKSRLVTLYTGRSSYGPPVASTSQADFEQAIGRCRFAYLWAFTSPSYPEPFYPLQRLGNRAAMLSAFRSDKESNAALISVLIEIQPVGGSIR